MILTHISYLLDKLLMNYPFHKSLLGTLLVFSVCSVAIAAPYDAAESDVQRADLMSKLNELTTSQSATFAEPSPSDEDLGEQLLLSTQQRYRSFYLYGGATEYWTSDASLVKDGIGSDWFTVMQVGLNWTPRIWGNLYAETFARQDLYRYARYSDLSFNSTNLGAGLTYLMPALGNLSLYSHYGFTYMGNASATSRIYDEQFVKIGLQKPISLSSAQMLYTGVNASLVLAGSPSYAMRDQFYAYANYQLAITKNTTLNAFYQAGYLAFRENQRSDFNQLLSGAISYKVLQFFTASAVISAGFNSSTDSYYNYSVMNLGVGINGALQF